MEKKMYVLVRHDLPPTYRAVQAGHAVAEYLLTYPDTQVEWNNGYLIYLRVSSEQELMEWHWEFEGKRPYAIFYEPDLGSQATALAVLSTGEEFKGVRLL